MTVPVPAVSLASATIPKGDQFLAEKTSALSLVNTITSTTTTDNNNTTTATVTADVTSTTSTTTSTTDAQISHEPLHHNEVAFENDAFLDTTNDTQEAGSFEGPEKLLEIWFGAAPYALQGIRTIPEGLPTGSPDASSSQADRYGLRIVPKPVWDEMLAIVKCQVLNQIQNDCMDAFLLSESSFFVYPHKLILKTCGTTTLLMALPKILEIAEKYCGLEKVWRVFYSRKTFMFPERQLHVHRDWKDEVEFLDRHFEHGSAYTVGKVNGDHWCLYLTAPQDDVLSNFTSRRGSVSSLQAAEDVPDVVAGDRAVAQYPLSIVTKDGLKQTAYEDSPLVSPKSSTSSSSSSSVSSSSSSVSMLSSSTSSNYLYPSYDQTVEILMTNLNPEAMKRFYQQPDDTPGTVGGIRVDQETGLAGLFPQAQLDSFLFTPCGYSANALQEGNYYTIHVTPEPVCSYASFETNIPVGLRSQKQKKNRSGDSTPDSEGTLSENEQQQKEAAALTYTGPSTLTELISRVVDIFQPGTMSVSLFSSHMTIDGEEESDKQQERRQRQMVKAMGRVQGFKRTDRILYEFVDCDMVFGHFERKN